MFYCFQAVLKPSSLLIGAYFFLVSIFLVSFVANPGSSPGYQLVAMMPIMHHKLKCGHGKSKLYV